MLCTPSLGRGPALRGNGRHLRAQGSQLALRGGGYFQRRPGAVPTDAIDVGADLETTGPVVRVGGSGLTVEMQGGPIRVSVQPGSGLSSELLADRQLGNRASLNQEAAIGEDAEVSYLTGRAAAVQKHFTGALGADDFMLRLEKALFAFGFAGDNSIAMVNLCRDEVTVSLKHRIEQIFGSSFSTNGLGGVLTCGVTGLGAGFSHSPLCSSNKERYVFFSLPHISINSRGEVGPMSRPGRPGQSCACGALIKATNEIKSEGLTCNSKVPGVHDFADPEMSVLKQRIARRLFHEGATDESVQGLTLVDVTKVAERTISDDLEHLISQTVDTSKADYAVITGVQVHNWAYEFEDDSPNLEFVASTSVYVVVDGVKAHLDIAAIPPMTPRQMRRVAGRAVVCERGGDSVLRAEEAPNGFDSKEARRARNERLQRYIDWMHEEGTEAEYAATALLQQSRAALAGETATPVTPAWQSTIARAEPERCATDDNSTAAIDVQFAEDSEVQQMRELLDFKFNAMPAAEKNDVEVPLQPLAEEPSQSQQPELEPELEPVEEPPAAVAAAAAAVEEGSKPRGQGRPSSSAGKRLGEVQADGSILYRDVHLMAGPKTGPDGSLIFTLALDE